MRVRDRSKVNLCARSFDSTAGLAAVLLHEYAHVQGIINECDADSFAYLTMVAANRVPKTPPYLQRCYYIRDLIQELNADVTKFKGRAFRLRPSTLEKLRQGRSFAQGDCVASVASQSSC